METLAEERPEAGAPAGSEGAEARPRASRSAAWALVVSMRPPEWIKNLLVFAGLLFSGKLDEGAQIVDATLTFTAFCAISSAGYLFNDLHDAPLDRRHPAKRHRPIASGVLPERIAWIAAVALAAAGILVALVGVSPEAAGFVALYGVTTVAYTLVVKRLVILDVMTIASLFILRVVAGAVAVEAHASEWLLLCTGMLALFLGFTKRRQEAMGEQASGIDHQLCDLCGQQPVDRQPDARHRTVGALRDLSLPLPDLRPRGHSLHRGDPYGGPRNAVRGCHLGGGCSRHAVRLRLGERADWESVV